MSIDIVDLETFYASPLGHRVVEELRQIMAHETIKDTAGCFGVGFTRPFLGDQVPTLMPAQQGTMVGSGTAILVDERALPFRDNQLDQIIACHFLEHCTDPVEAVSELYRVLVPEGRLHLIVANRRGIWSRRERTPFGVGRPYSRGQIRRLAQQIGFMPVGWRSALYFLPSNSQPARMIGPVLDRFGRHLWPELAGVHIVTCIKRVPAPTRMPRQYVRFSPPLIRPAVSRAKV